MKNRQRLTDEFDEIYESEFSIREEDEDVEWLESFWTLSEKDIIQTNKIDSNKINILLIEDDRFVAQEYGFELMSEGYCVIYCFNSDDALRIVNYCGDVFDIVVIDIRMYHGAYFNSFETSMGKRTGQLLALELSDTLKSASFIALTNSNDASDEAWFNARPNFFFCNKSQYDAVKFSKFIRSSIMKDFSKLRTFIVHGHDYTAALELKNYLQNRLGFSEPVILAEQASLGMTVIEKFEKHAKESDIVFALFTPDDNMLDENKRARQNVIFEYGYFMGLLGRLKGKVIMLYKKGVEIPSDLFGVVYIDVTNGIESSGEKIRREIEALM